MSHYTKCDLKITNLDAVKKAFTRMGWKFKENAKVRGYAGQTLDGAISVDMGKSYDIGVIQQEDGTYGIVADWWGIEVSGHGTQAEIEDMISREYAYARVVTACEEQGYSMEETSNENGGIQLVMKRWA